MAEEEAVKKGLSSVVYSRILSPLARPLPQEMVPLSSHCISRHNSHTFSPLRARSRKKHSLSFLTASVVTTWHEYVAAGHD
jgi:hypothetical protein